MASAFSGVWTALATPFKNQQIDADGLKKLIDYQVKGGVDGVIACGTTGESATLSWDEKLEVIALTVKYAKGRVKVLAGTGTSSTSETIRFTEAATKLKPDGCLVVTPAYNKPTQDGLVEHYKAVAKCTRLPIMLYNVPGRTACNMLPETAARIAAECKNVVATKEASGNITQMSQVKVAAPNLTLLSGDDGLTLPSLAIGSEGVVSVITNVAPKLMSGLLAAWNSGKLEKARQLHEQAQPLIETMFAEANPIPVKYALSIMGIGDGSVRLPLLPASAKLKPRVDGVLKSLKLV